MATGNETNPGPTIGQHSGDTTESDDGSWAVAPSNGVPADHVPELESPDHESPADVGDRDPVGNNVMINQEEAGTSMALDSAENSAAISNDLTSSDRPLNNETAQDTNPQGSPAPGDGPADEFPKFRDLPAELRTIVWEQAFLQDGFRFFPPLPLGSIQRFRFDLRYDPDRVKPGRDESRGETRAIMWGKGNIEYLTVHQIQLNARGSHVGYPSKCKVPFNFARDVFCVEGISSGFWRSDRYTKHDFGRIKDKERALVWRPVAERLENALGLRFAPRIKRLAIIPQYTDTFCNSEFVHGVGYRFPRFITEQFGWDMAALAKRFPSLVSVRSAIPLHGCRDLPRLGNSTLGYFQWYGASLRGHGQGGPTGMSEEERDVVFGDAWHRIFDVPFKTCYHKIKKRLWKRCVCLVRRSKGKTSMVDEFPDVASNR